MSCRNIKTWSRVRSPIVDHGDPGGDLFGAVDVGGPFGRLRRWRLAAPPREPLVSKEGPQQAGSQVCIQSRRVADPVPGRRQPDERVLGHVVRPVPVAAQEVRTAPGRMETGRVEGGAVGVGAGTDDALEAVAEGGW